MRLLLDDFGTGYSSLRYLQRYPLDGLKSTARSSPASARTATRRRDRRGDRRHGAGARHAASIPEGVETEGQLARLSALGCDYAQGFLLSRPLPAAEIEALLR